MQKMEGADELESAELKALQTGFDERMKKMDMDHNNASTNDAITELQADNHPHATLVWSWSTTTIAIAMQHFDLPW